MPIIASLKYLGNGTWLYRGEQGTVIVTSSDQPALNAILKEGGDVVATLTGGIQDTEEAIKISIKAVDNNGETVIRDGATLAISVMSGAIFTPVVGLGVGFVVDKGLGAMQANPNANLDYAHEFNFEGSPYHQESNLLNPPQEISVDISRDLRDLFNRSEIAYTNGIGPDGLPWGTTTEVAPKATAAGGFSPQPG